MNFTGGLPVEAKNKDMISETNLSQIVSLVLSLQFQIFVFRQFESYRSQICFKFPVFHFHFTKIDGFSLEKSTISRGQSEVSRDKRLLFKILRRTLIHLADQLFADLSLECINAPFLSRQISEPSKMPFLGFGSFSEVKQKKLTLETNSNIN